MSNIQKIQDKPIKTLNANPHKPNQDEQIGEFRTIRENVKNSFNELVKNGASEQYIVDGKEYSREEIDKNPDIFKTANTAKITTKAGSWQKTTTLGHDQLGSSVIEIKYQNNSGSIFERTKLTKDQCKVEEFGAYYNGEDRVYQSTTYNLETGKAMSYSHDINMDGINELEQSYYANGQVGYERADNNSDGVVDRISEYDEAGNLIYEYEDINCNGTGKTKKLVNGKLKVIDDTRSLGEKISDWWNKRD